MEKGRKAGRIQKLRKRASASRISTIGSSRRWGCTLNVARGTVMRSKRAAGAGAAKITVALGAIFGRNQRIVGCCSDCGGDLEQIVVGRLTRRHEARDASAQRAREDQRDSEEEGAGDGELRFVAEID